MSLRFMIAYAMIALLIAAPIFAYLYLSRDRGVFARHQRRQAREQRKAQARL